ncbi:MogA/MoaB family molybdenum cofactor biosynthesis protein [Geosporobacter ferrireducens]|uniref:Molybdenum cofactor biosynthesis protein n=1 Tax=Geosporobacter ferrireducens TaxID=1424294 RepID=A0A1D8GLH2_9FIRM|nr:MogA/MoaB family molybdenum cofactor biosynthesis protein [Geosporobacter ferrireducens]AOT71748.1 molybdenum cofactor biosynthesis protein [Geosporobacter ferrireducens]MTI55530.1 MogA/MoaB family molybdenum cofactor biosynthesis protein [Geosporobacter ferrireducens]
MFTLGIIISSDKGSKGERVDESGKVIQEMMKQQGYEIKKYIVLPDEKELLAAEMIYMTDELGVDLLLTSGGTGFSKRDITPEATLTVVERLTPGISEAIRYNSLKITPRAMLSRAISGIRKDTLIINLPGSPKAVRESLEYIIPHIGHGLEILRGSASECARK